MPGRADGRKDSTYRKRTGEQTDVSRERKLWFNLHFLQVGLVVLVVPTTEKNSNREESEEEQHAVLSSKEK